MSHAVVRTQSAQEAEYARCLTEIEVRKRRIGDLQADLELLKQALARFELEYRARVGPLLAEIDRLRLAIAECRRRVARLRADDRLDPEDLEQELATEFGARRERVEVEEAEARRYQQAFQQERTRTRFPADVEEEIRQIYRELAKRFHPDLARGETERARRQELMLRINEAFRERDLAALQALARETEGEAPGFAERPLAARLRWARQELERLDVVAEDLSAQIILLRRSDSYPLWQSPETGSAAIARMQIDAERKVSRLQDRLDEVTLTYRRLAERLRRSHAAAEARPATTRSA